MKISLANQKEVAHVWAQQNQSEGKAANMFFRDKSIYSYGDHFEIARFITPDVVFFTTRDYSSTTSKHKRYTLSSIYHKTVFTVPSFEDHAENLERYAMDLEECFIKFGAARKNGEYLYQNLRDKLSEMERYCNQFKKLIPAVTLKSAKKTIKSYQDKDYSAGLEVAKKRARESSIKNAEANRLRKIEREKQDAETIAKWRRGEGYGGVSHLPLMLRLSDIAVETSRGATIPIEAAKGLYALLKAGRPLHGLKLAEHYTVTSFDGKILTVGCHKIPIEEIDHIAELLHLNDPREVTLLGTEA